MKSRALVRTLLLLGIALAAYAGTYAFLSQSGVYVSSRTGNVKFAGVAAINDVNVWRPKWLQLKISLNENGGIEREANFGGWLFYPLEMLDRRYWHPTQHPFLDLLNGLQQKGS